ncbi:MAG: response regulator [Verrucomicrobiota bacterium]|nr:response regulator [Verrucomicrobiota bacterium]
MATILIVDDSNFSRRMMRAILEPAGHAIHEASDGLTAIEQYAVVKPEIVLLDLTMKGMHGLDVLRKLKGLDPNARVIVATADIQTPVQEEAKATGAVGFLPKPFKSSEVLAAVTSALAIQGQCN